MGVDAFAKERDVVAAFEDTDDSATCVSVGDLDRELGELDEVLGFESEIADGIGGVGIEPGGDDDEIGPSAVGEIGEGGANRGEVLSARRAESNG
jgi:hypothetical protein